MPLFTSGRPQQAHPPSAVLQQVVLSGQAAVELQDTLDTVSPSLRIVSVGSVPPRREELCQKCYVFFQDEMSGLQCSTKGHTVSLYAIFLPIANILTVLNQTARAYF